jgi:L,D-peptidoglycan transpeptidase YkuD (ErfK/YbiS/YcfS/YnhG family)
MLMTALLNIALCAHASSAKIPESWAHYLKMAEDLAASQLLMVFTSRAEVTRAELFCLEKVGNEWHIAIPAMAASVGRKGIAEPESKREGDGKTPYGMYHIGMAFGYESDCPTRMPYRQMQSHDIWVDDPAAEDYNRLVHLDRTKAKSFEYMRRKDDLYKFGLVVEYNTNPIVPGLGSAIFIHYWGRPFRSTAGCLGLSEQNLQAVLSFLDPAKSPVIGFYRKDIARQSFK